MERTELTCWLRLLLTEGIGRTSGRKLLATFGLPEAVFEQSAAALEHIVTPAQADALLQEPPELAEQVQTTWQWLQAEPDTRRVLTLGDALLPPAPAGNRRPAAAAVRQWHGSGLATQPAQQQCHRLHGHSRQPQPHAARCRKCPAVCSGHGPGRAVRGVGHGHGGGRRGA